MPIQEKSSQYSHSSDSPGERAILETLGKIRRQGWVLLVQTYALFWMEIREKTRLLAKDTLIILLGGTFLWVSLLAFVAASIILLSSFVPLWLAALIISIIFGFFGMALTMAGIAIFRRRTIAPQLAAQALRDNARWLKEKMAWTNPADG